MSHEKINFTETVIGLIPYTGDKLNISEESGSVNLNMACEGVREGTIFYFMYFKMSLGFGKISNIYIMKKCFKFDFIALIIFKT